MKQFSFVTITLGIVMLLAQLAMATNYYVSAETGNDAYNGLSVATAFRSIQSAANLTNPGDTVFVMNGQYIHPTTNTTLILSRSGAPGAPIVYINYPGHRPLIRYNGFSGISPPANTSVSYIVIQGFRIQGNSRNTTLSAALTQPGSCSDGSGGAGTPIALYNGVGIQFNGRTGGRCHHIIIRNNEIFENTSAGIGTLECDYVTIEDNIIHDNAWYTIYGTSGISVGECWNYDNNTTDYKIIIRRNIVYGNYEYVPVRPGLPRPCTVTDGNGIIIDSNNNTKSGRYQGKTLIENNVVFRNGGRGIHSVSCDKIDVINNTTFRNSLSPAILAGELTQYASTNMRYINNIAVPLAGKPAINFTGPPNSLTANSAFVDHNLLYNATPSDPVGTNVVSGYPEFADTTLNIFYLKNSSPAINAGSTISGTFAQKDFYGFDRPQSMGIDLGAYESTGVVPTDPTNFSANQVKTNQVLLFWQDNAINETNYILQRRALGSTFQTIATLPINATQYSDTSLDPERTYEYSLVATNGISHSAPVILKVETLPVIATDSIRLVAVADAQVSAGVNQGNNYGGASSLGLKNNPNLDITREAFLRFDLTGINKPIVQGVLQLNETAIPTGSNTHQLDLIQSVDWFEGTGAGQAAVGESITWANSRLFVNQAQAGFFSPVQGINRVPLEASVIQAVTGSLATFRLFAWQDATFTYSSREATSEANRPALILYTEKLTPPSNLTISGPPAQLQWTDNSTNESGFEIQRREANTQFTTIASISANVTSYNDPTGVPGTQYIYRVYATLADQKSAFSNSATPPLVSITKQPVSGTTVCPGASISVSVSVSGPVYSYQWYKNGATLSGVSSATTANLVLPAITIADAGEYTVVITSFNSLTSTSFSLAVNSTPSISLVSGGSISCVIPTVTLIASPESGLTYAFSSGASQVNSGNTATVNLPGTYSVLVTTVQGCTASTSTTVSGSLAVPETPNVNSVSAIQGAASVTLTVSNCSGTLNWNGSDGVSSIMVSTSVVGEYAYSVVCKVGACMSVPTSVTVSIKPLPISLSIQHKDGDNNQLVNNIIKPNLTLYNTGNIAIPYSDITFRYWLTAEDFAPMTNLAVYWAQIGTNKVRMKYVSLAQPRQGALGYIEYSFDTSAGTLAAGSSSGEIQTGVAKQNWTNFNEADDYSFAANTNYTVNDRITVYYQGSLVNGVEPALASSLTALKVYFENKNTNATSTNQLSANLKVVNAGNQPINYDQLTVRYWFTAEGNESLVYTVDYAELGAANIKSKFVRENRTGADTYLELAFSSGLGQLSALSSTGSIQQRVNKSNWSNFNEINDFSYQAVGPATENSKITAYLNGSLVYGQEPTLSGARLNVEELSLGMHVRILENPVREDAVKVEVQGVEGETVQLRLIDSQGRVVADYSALQQGYSAQYRMPVHTGLVGILLLHVSTNQLKQSIRVLKH